MAKLYSIPEADTLGMLGDAHSTNYAENREFFMNQNNPANFERTWNTAYLLYRKMNRISQAVPFDKVMDFSILQKLDNEEPYQIQPQRISDQLRAQDRAVDQGRGLGNPDQGRDAAFLSELLGPAQEDHRS